MDQSLKIVINLFGKEKVGQTKLLYTMNKPWEDELVLGLDFISKDIILNAIVYKVQVWRNESSNIIYFLIFDMTNRDTFTYLNEIVDSINKTEKKGTNLIYIY